MANPERIQNVGEILKKYHEEGQRFGVVFSAFGGITDSLQEMSHLAAKDDEAYLQPFNAFCHRHREAVFTLLTGDYRSKALEGIEENLEVLRKLLFGISLLKESSSRTVDLVMSFGERNSALIITEYLKQLGLPAIYLDARKTILTDDHFGAGRVDFEATNKNIQAYFSENTGIPVITGFLAATKNGLTTTLGRGGSDYTAAIFAAALDAEQIEIWTDVDGVMTANPREVKRAFTIPSLSYAEAMEMSHFGAKVIYPPTLQPALAKKIPLWIKNTFNPSFEGTYISDQVSSGKHAVKGISSISKVALLTIQGSGMIGVPGTASRLFGGLAQQGVNVILITQGSSEHSISFAVQPYQAAAAKQAAQQVFEYELKSGLLDPIKIEEELSIIAVIGEEMRYRPGISGQLFSALGRNGINIVAIAQGSSELNISLVINCSDEQKALNAIHDAFFLSDKKELHLFMVGVGLIGSTLIQQIKEQLPFLMEKRQLDLKLVGLANSKVMAFNENGIPLDDWRAALESADTKMDMKAFVEKMNALNFSNSIFVDCTANEGISDHYESILKENIAISTPNKFSTSSSLERYKALKHLSNSKGVPFFYETNVGAGLPVLTTIQDLIESGDRFLKIEGVLSGSLSFIFNNFKGESSFSEIVKEARKRGYTEPDPREDLSGADVKRKILILGREIGLPLEADDVIVENLLPQDCLDAPDVEVFFKTLEENDAYFEKLLEDAQNEAKALRFIARLEDGEARVGLQRVDQNSPFYGLNGSDNMMVFTTERYKERPLVIRGPGAGAEVTAAGVFAEIIKIGTFF